MKKAASMQAGNAKSSCQRWAGVRKWAPLAGGGALALIGLTQLGRTRRSRSAMALAAAGGLVALVGAKHNFSTRKFSASSSVLIQCTPEEAFTWWRDFERLPRFMHHLESVTVTGDRRSQWVALGPLGARIRWDAEITDERENDSIAWRSLPGSDIQVDGSVTFREAPADRGTLLCARICYSAPVGSVGQALAKLFGKDPNFLMRQDLRRFRALLETGEIATTEGQTHGPRSAKSGIFRMLDPDAPAPHGAASETYSQNDKRRVS